LAPEARIGQLSGRKFGKLLVRIRIDRVATRATAKGGAETAVGR